VRTGAIPPARPTFLWNIRRTGSSTPCGTPTNPTVEPGRVDRAVRADALEHRVRAHAVGEVEHLLLAVLAALGDDVRRTEPLGDLLPGLVP
jgi:hypothetical protein